jgi:GntR family transcriptional regulator
MAEGGRTAEPVVVRASGKQASKEISNQWRRGWRSVFLFGVTVALVLAGFAFWLASAVGRENASLEADTPQLLGVFSTYPNTIIHVTAEVFWHDAIGPGRLPYEAVYVSATAPRAPRSATILITSSVQPGITVGLPDHTHFIPNPLYESAVFYSDIEPFSILDSHEYVAAVPLSYITQTSRIEQSQYGSSVGFFELPQVTQESHGSFFAHLPDIGIDTGSFDPLPYLFGERSTSSQREQLVEDPELKDLRNYPYTGYASSASSEYQAPPGQRLQTAYWQPASLTTTEILEDAKPELENAGANSIVPDGSLQGDNYVWQGGGFLEPTMNLTNEDAAASHSTWSFFSGIAFGVAAGTLVAFIQEEDNPLLSLLTRFLGTLWLTVRAKLPSRRVEADLRRRCQAPEWAPGERLPTVTEMASHYGVAQNTIMKALRRMAHDGLVEIV